MVKVEEVRPVQLKKCAGKESENRSAVQHSEAEVRSEKIFSEA